MPCQTEVVRSMIYLQESKPDLTRTAEYWIGNVGPGYGRPRKSSRRTWTPCNWTFFPLPSPDRPEEITRVWASVMM